MVVVVLSPLQGSFISRRPECNGACVIVPWHRVGIKLLTLPIPTNLMEQIIMFSTTPFSSHPKGVLVHRNALVSFKVSLGMWLYNTRA